MSFAFLICLGSGVFVVSARAHERKREITAVGRAADSGLTDQEGLMPSLGFSPAIVQVASTCGKWT